MMRTIPARRKQRHSEEGYILLWVMFMLAVFTIWLSVAVPRAAKEIQRDHEVETMHRGKQYIRAVQLYYRKFHAYPPNADALTNTNEIRFLRKKYIDPTTGKVDWKPIRLGQAKTQSTGFFGQPIAGAGTVGSSVMAGIGPSGNPGLGGSTPNSGIGGNSGFGGSSLFDSGSSTNPGSTPPAAGGGAAGAGGTPPGAGSGATGTTGTGGSGGATGTGGSGGTTGTSSSSSSSSAFGSPDQTFGGAGIVGFSPAGTKTSILIYRKKQHYNEWEFVYEPLLDMRTQSGNTGQIGQPASSTSTPVGSSGFGSGFGSGSGSGSGFGTGGGFGSSPSPAPGTGTGTPPPAPQPQQ